ncbi:SDR family NAD(P)-dependent oxidoreductase [Rhodopila sp.]|jgi:NAD(P)-dependent dehydrogenase (short-subunit alcohol dehydrogenase family)|uniref:SDR family NAD(P)-dependent oxidoreductase n=1 Tax=Rhodopila sp. TaxID=2480087 RepID=UPI002BD40BD7|nr:SDR family NAD(P)-dependent oxidoreductase [Rhodopila sp.]HVZ08132.1 SDR family NAD(P)-dependent oxidoreductase [Rhodopila sp.]
MLSLNGKVAIVAGAGSVGDAGSKIYGNGKATAVLMARQGASVFLVDINEAAVNETKALIEAEGGTCATHVCDLMVAADVQEMVQACVSRFKRIDILVNNVGGSAPGDPVSMSEEVWDRQIDFNLKTAFLGCKYVIPVMLEQGKGAIVNIASVAGMRNDFLSGRSHVGYSASKAGVIQLSRSVAGTYAKKGIRVNTVVPGLMHTPLVEYRLARTVGGNDAQKLIDARNAAVPMGHMGDAWDVAHAVLFLASDEARFITATEIIVDGGSTASMP